MTIEQAEKVFIAASRQPILIITSEEKTAGEIHDGLMELARMRMFPLISRKTTRYRIYVNGYETILVMPLEKWINEKYKARFGGLVLITTKKIPVIPETVRQPERITDFFERVKTRES